MLDRKPTVKPETPPVNSFHLPDKNKSITMKIKLAGTDEWIRLGDPEYPGIIESMKQQPADD